MPIAPGALDAAAVHSHTAVAQGPAFDPAAFPRENVKCRCAKKQTLRYNQPSALLDCNPRIAHNCLAIAARVG